MYSPNDVFHDALPSGEHPVELQKIKRALRHVTTEKTISDNEIVNLAMDGRTAHRLEHHYNPIYPWGEGLWLAGKYLELARITIPQGQMGIIRQCEVDWVHCDTDDSNFSWDTAKCNADNSRMSFHVRYQPVSTLLGPRAIANVGVKGIAGLPGLPYYYARSWTQGYYPFGNQNNRVNWPAYHGYHYRLFALCIEDIVTRNHELGGRFVASIQSQESLSAAWNARRNWT